jgi:hypothetical protein
MLPNRPIGNSELISSGVDCWRPPSDIILSVLCRMVAQRDIQLRQPIQRSEDGRIP